MGTYITDILDGCTTILNTLFSSTVSTLGTIAMLPIVGGVIGVVVSVTRKGRG